MITGRNRYGWLMGAKLACQAISFFVAFMVLLIVLVSIVAALSGCSAIKPDVVESPVPSWDGSTQNSGLVADVSSSMTVTPHWRDRYNSLILAYGSNFKPALTADEGITPGAPGGNYYANHFARIHFYEMNVWNTSAMHQPPAKK